MPTEPPKHLTFNTGLVIGVSFAGIAVVLLLVIVFLLRRMQRNQLTQADVYRFLRGSPEEANRNLPTHEKVDILPYDASYEILLAKFSIGTVTNFCNRSYRY